MLEVPSLEAIVREKTCQSVRQGIVTVLEGRLGDVPGEVREELEPVVNEKQRQGLVRLAATGPDLDAFRKALAEF